jgi:AraC-like DNA-binding protein
MHPQTFAARRRLYMLARLLVARHYSRRLTLAVVAGALASSPRQLQRAYAQFGDRTFHEDLLARRMAAAAQLLAEQPAIAVRDVARLVGYRQASHFARTFGHRYGLSPARFREQARSDRGRARRATLSGLPGRSAAAQPVATPVETASPASTASAPGRSSRISVPPPGAGSAVTLPPCWSATCRTIASPSPEPGRPRASAPR